MSGHLIRLLLVTVAVATASFGCEKQPATTAPATTAATPTPATPTTGVPTPDQNVRAYVDPVTGELREPTAAELAAEAATKKQDAAAAQSKPRESREVTLPNGAIAIELDDSAKQPLRACIQPNGELKMDHECNASEDGKKQ